MLTQDEADLYDRQIRLWGVNAQSRIRQSKVLMLGFNGIASEVAKILVLAGIDALTIVDDQQLQESDLTSNLFCRPNGQLSHPNPSTFRTHDVKAKLRTLNPLVNVGIKNSPILSINLDDYKDYDLVTLHSFLTIEEVETINQSCRKNGNKFYVVLDYGFFGFMFNDLGTEFKFTYEEFGNFDKKCLQPTGVDPISIGEDDLKEEFDDVGYATSDDEDNRPKKKRRRLFSPKREFGPKDDNEKQTKVGSLPYVTFADMVSLKNTTFTKHTSPVLLISIAMFKFYTQHKHLPRYENPQAKVNDISGLNEIIVSLRDSLQLPDNVFKSLDKHWSDSIYGSLSPVCAVLGGVAGQDMIRAISNKDIPINNTFAFDGISMNGIVDQVGISDTIAQAAPIVRDFLQIDDDD